MATQKLKFGPQFMQYGLIHPIYALNLRPSQDYGSDDESETKDTLSSLAANGWIDQKSINCFLLSDEQKEAAVLYRTDRLKALEEESAKDQESRDLLFVLRRLWTDGNGKVITPEVGNNMGFRRMRLYPKSQVFRMRIKPEDRAQSETDILTQIPVNVKNYADENDRVADQLIENEREGVGKKEVSFLAKLTASKPLFDAGRNEAFFRKVVFKDGVGQKIFSILKVNALQPAARIMERVVLPETDVEYIPAQSLNPSVMRPLYKDGKIPAQAEVEEVVYKVKNGVINTPKMADRTTIDNLSKHNPNPVVRLVCGYLIANQTTQLNDTLAPMSAHFDEVLRYTNAGKGAELLAYLKAFKA